MRDARMADGGGEREHGAVVGIGAAERVADREANDDKGDDGPERAGSEQGDDRRPRGHENGENAEP